MAALPDVPTMIEAGIKDYVVALWMAFAMPGATPDAIPRRLNAEMTAILTEAEMVEALRKQAFAASGFFFATPEYNGFTSAALKNAIDWLSRAGPEGVSPLKGKPMAIVSAGGGGGGIEEKPLFGALRISIEGDEDGRSLVLALPR